MDWATVRGWFAEIYLMTWANHCGVEAGHTDALVFGAAVTQQKGDCYINEQPPEVTEKQTLLLRWSL